MFIYCYRFKKITYMYNIWEDVLKLIKIEYHFEIHKNIVNLFINKYFFL